MGSSYQDTKGKVKSASPKHRNGFTKHGQTHIIFKFVDTLFFLFRGGPLHRVEKMSKNVFEKYTKGFFIYPIY